MLEVDNIIHALDYIYNKGRCQTGRVCSVPYLLPSYNKCKRLDSETEGNTQKYYQKYRIESSYWVHELVKQSGDCMSRRGKKRDTPYDGFDAEIPEQKRSWRSNRQATQRMVSPTNDDDIVISGEPPNGDEMWCHQTIIEAMAMLEGIGKTKESIQQIIAVGKTSYHSSTGVYWMYFRWKKNGLVPKKRGAPLCIGAQQGWGGNSIQV